MAEKGSWGMQLAVLAAWGFGIVLAGKLLATLSDRGFRNILQTHGGGAGIAVSAGQMCQKYPSVGACPNHIAQYGVGSQDSTNPGTLLAQKLFRAGQQNPYAPNPFASPTYQYAAAAL